MKCCECDEEKAKHPDPRTPPLKQGVCLCATCAEIAIDEMIDELQNLREELRSK